MTGFTEVTGVIDGAEFRFQCPRCSMEHTWSAEQVMNMADNSVADYCSGCGGGFRVLKPTSAFTGRAKGANDTSHSQSLHEESANPSYTRTTRAMSPTVVRYKVVPFIGRTHGSVSASDVASQLESAIQEHASAGWEFYQLSDVNIEVQPGCIAGLFGATVQYVRFDQLIFRSTKERP